MGEVVDGRSEDGRCESSVACVAALGLSIVVTMVLPSTVVLMMVVSGSSVEPLPMTVTVEKRSCTVVSVLVLQDTMMRFVRTVVDHVVVVVHEEDTSWVAGIQVFPSESVNSWVLATTHVPSLSVMRV